ncbi:MAG: SDR family oxidoreductase [Flavobacteriaceae bacterium]|nr:SDR family oxidoreductase [Flavobacteriaceae bacterium]
MKTILITGSSKGIGLALAQHYLEAGWQVAGIARGEPGIDHKYYKHFHADISKEVEVVAAVKGVKRAFGHVDALLNNAALAGMNHLISMPAENFFNIMNTNSGGTFLLMREVGKQMIRQNNGRIVNFTSVSVPLCLETQTAYAASKAAVESMTRIAARELAPFHITVNAIGSTPMDIGLARGIREEWQQNVLNMQAIPRKAEIADLIHSIDYFIAENAQMVTGQIIFLGGVW